LLPALDLLDRGLVTRFVLASDSNKPPEQAEHAQASHSELNDAGRKQTIAYYVRTAQKPSSRSRAAQATTSYEVHLTAWSCSCPAFAFAAFPASLPLDNSVGYTAMEQDEAAEGDWFRETGWRFGGLTRGNDVPTCKHLLACMIAEKCGGFARLVEEKEVGVEEAAGWAAGWGDWIRCDASSEDIWKWGPLHERNRGSTNGKVNVFTSAKGSVAALNVVLLVI
jgi:hypothetical protein